MSDKKKIFSGITLLLFVLPLAAILYYRPYFGLMDDWSNFFLVLPRMHSQGVFLATWDYAKQDLLWGMFRPIYPLMIWILYQPAAVFGSTMLFVLNWVLVLFSLYILNKSLSQLSGIALPFLFLGDFAWFHFHDIFQHPSLQEKLLFLFGGALLLQCLAYVRDQKSYRCILILLFLAFGLLSKASFCLYAAMGFIVVCGVKKHSAFSRLFLALYGFAIFLGAFILRHIAQRGSYTQQNFSLFNIFTNAKTATGLFLLLLCVVATVVFLRDWMRSKFTAENTSLLSLLVGVLAFLAIFLPWGMGGYLDTDIAAIATALALFLCVKLFPQRLLTPMAYALVMLASFITSYKAITTNIRLSDIRVAVESIDLLKRENISQILVPCAEGSDAMRIYWKHAGWNGELHRSDFVSEQPKSGQVIFYDQGFCTLPGRASAVVGCEQEELLPVRWARSFHLVRLKNCRS